MKYTFTNRNFLLKKVGMIKALRTSFDGLSLKDAKSITDRFDSDTVSEVEIEMDQYTYHKVNSCEELKLVLSPNNTSVEDEQKRLLKLFIDFSIDAGDYGSSIKAVELIQHIEGRNKITH